MTPLELQKCRELNAPFTLHVGDGRSLFVPHGDYVFFPPRATAVTLAVPDEDEQELPYHIVPLLMISGVSHASPKIQ